MEVTVREVIDAIEKNGYPQGFGRLIRFNENSELEGACAIGQAAINLGVDEMVLYRELSYLIHKKFSVKAMIVSLNDTERYPLPAIATTLRTTLGSLLSVTLRTKKKDWSWLKLAK